MVDFNFSVAKVAEKPPSLLDLLYIYVYVFHLYLPLRIYVYVYVNVHTEIVQGNSTCPVCALVCDTRSICGHLLWTYMV